MKTDLTVVVPVYNVEKYLKRCIDSLLAQTYQINIIIVDDGSTDGSGIIADKYKVQQNVTVIHKQNGGLSSARNIGIDNCNTQFIAFVDSDDYVDKDMYEELMLKKRKFGAEMSICGVWVEYDNGIKKCRHNKIFEISFSNEDALIALNNFKYFNMSVWNVVYDTAIFNSKEIIRFPEGKLSEDAFVMHKLISRTTKVVFYSKPMYHYLQRINGISWNKKVNKYPIEAAKEQLKYFEEFHPNLIYVGKCALSMAYISVYNSFLRMNLECPKEYLIELQKGAKEYIYDVLKNKEFSIIKRIQAFVFCYSIAVYKCILKHKFNNELKY